MMIYHKHSTFNPDLFSVGSIIIVAGMALELRHEQGCYYLVNNTRASGSIVFYALGISDKEAFCSSHYGYELTKNCDFPRTKMNDWPGIGRLAAALLQRSEEMGFLNGRKAFASAEKLKQICPKYNDWIVLGAFGVYFIDIDIETKRFFLNGKRHNLVLNLRELDMLPSDFFSESIDSETEPGRALLAPPADYETLRKGLIALLEEFELKGLLKN